MRAQRARRLVAASAVGIVMAGGAAIGTAGTAAAAAPAVQGDVVSDWCFHHDWRCSDHGGSRFHHRFDHRFDHRFGHTVLVIIVLR
ncbi:hypothetical protein [Streptomyces sp. NPDC046727]|uniref:hypothetical protein n=1 Tax=Streptomyces sp. NPDC046727 TaxID=3155373 RepID=UPI003407BA8B